MNVPELQGLMRGLPDEENFIFRVEYQVESKCHDFCLTITA